MLFKALQWKTNHRQEKGTLDYYSVSGFLSIRNQSFCVEKEITLSLVHVGQKDRKDLHYYLSYAALTQNDSAVAE